MIESLGNSITDYAKQEREMAYSRENSVKTAETKAAEASSEAGAIAESQQQTADTAEVKTRPPQYDTVEISEEGRAMVQQSGNETAQAAASTSVASTEDDTQESETASPASLASYTERELDQLVEDGTITTLQKNAELATRAAEESAKEAAQAAEAKDNSGAVTGEEMALNGSQLAAGAAAE